MIRRPLVCACVVLAATALGAVAAGAVPLGGPVGPNQQFGGLVNGNNGVASPARIRMACFGPVRPGQRGHPMRGQSVNVFRPEAILVRHPGFTGASANRIVASFGPSPSATAAANTVILKQYGVDKPIPTSLLLPCAGTGTVSFTPMPKSLKSRAATVRVSYVGQP